MGRTILKVHEPTSGQIIFDGVDITGLSNRKMFPYRKKMQMIFQDPYASLNPRFTVGEIIEEPMIIHNMGTAHERKVIVQELIETVGLKPDHIRRYPHEFSGGQRQRIGIARTLALRPEFIVCDEPISALDVSIQAQVINLLEKLQREKGFSYLFIAHDLEMVHHISHKIGVMYLGNMVELSIINCPLKKLDVSPLKNTLETLYVGDRQQFYTKYREVYKKTKFTTLDLSMMKKLKEVYGSGAGSIKTVRLKNPKKHVRVKTLQELHLYGTKIKSIDVSGLTKLQKLYVGNCTTKCNINKCTKLEELGIINRGTTDLSLKSKSLKHLQYRGGKVKKLSVKKCPKLYAVTIRGTKAKSLDFKGNKNLLYLSIYNSNIGKVVYPKVKKADWRYEYKIQDKRFSSDPITNAEESGIFTYEHYLGGYNINQVKTVDISAWKRLSSAMKKRQLANGYKFVMKQYTPRRIIINKKLRSSDKKWIRAVAKKIKAKVIMW